MNLSKEQSDYLRCLAESSAQYSDPSPWSSIAQKIQANSADPKLTVWEMHNAFYLIDDEDAYDNPMVLELANLLESEMDAVASEEDILSLDAVA